MMSLRLIFVATAVLLATVTADRCRVNGQFGLCIPSTSCTADGRTPVATSSCPEFTECCPGFRASSCSVSDGRSGRCLSEDLCATGGGESPEKSSCGGPDLVKCCVYPGGVLPGANKSCFGRRGVGKCKSLLTCVVSRGPGYVFHRNLCAGSQGCCINAPATFV